MAWGLVLCFFAHLVIRDCDSYRKFKRGFGVDDSSLRQDYVLFLRFETVGNRDGCLQAFSDDDTTVTSMLSEMYSDHQKFIDDKFIDDKTLYLDFFNFCF